MTIIKYEPFQGPSILQELNSNRLILCGSHQLSIINMSNDIIEHTIIVRNIIHSLIQLRDDNILVGCIYGVLYLYDITLRTLLIKQNKIDNKTILCLLNINS